VAVNPAAQAEYKALGDLYMKQNKPPQALEMYRKYLEKAPMTSRWPRSSAKTP